MSTIKFSVAAQRNIEETGCDPQDDLAAIRGGAHTRESLLAHCLDGVDADRVDGWREYVATICEEALVGHPFQLHLIAGSPSNGDRHVDPGADARMLSMHATRADAMSAGRDYLREHPTAWLQIDGQGGNVEDVAA